MKPSPLFYFTLYMSLIGGNWIVYHTALPIRITHHIILTLFLVWWLLKRGLPDTPLLMPIAGLVFVLALSGVNAIDRRMALEYGWHWLTNWLLFLYLIDALRAEQGSTLFKAIFVGGALLAVSCILEWLAIGGRPAGLFGVINLTGGYLAALVVPSLGWAIARPKYRKLLMGFMAFSALAIVMNQSRGPALSVLVALTAFGYLAIKEHPLLKIASGIATMGLCAIIVLGLSLEPQHSTGDVVRLDLWKAGEDMLMDYPSGVGGGLFAQAYHERSRGDQWTGAHNYYITLGAELGAPGLAGGAAFLLVMLYLIIPQSRTIQQKAVLAGGLGILAHMLGDNYPAQNWTFLVSLYGAYLVYEVRWLNAPLPGFIARLLIYALFVYGLLFAIWDVAQIHYENGLRLQSAEEVQTAIALDPHNRLYKLEAAQLLNPAIALSSDYALTNFGRVYYRHG